LPKRYNERRKLRPVKKKGSKEKNWSNCIWVGGKTSHREEKSTAEDPLLHHQDDGSETWLHREERFSSRPRANARTGERRPRQGAEPKS